MKKAGIVAVLILCILLTGCGQRLPEKTVDGMAWNAGWTKLGVLGAETPEGWSLRRSEDVLAAEGTYYAAWTAGEAFTYPNEEGGEITAYDGEIHLVVMEAETPEKAAETVQELQTMTLERYPDLETSAEEYAGQSFEVCTYTAGESAGASATGLRGETVIRVDVTARSQLGQDPAQVLAEFLEHCHYAA